MLFFTGDEHYLHANIIEYCNRPFKHIIEMNQALIKNHNEVVKENDTTIHIGDTSMARHFDIEKLQLMLNGKHIFLRGSHDKWMKKDCYHEIWEQNINGQYLVACHYAMRVWPRSHYNSWQVYGHSHGGLPPIGKQWDVGVDNNNFYPVSFDQLVEIMKKQPDNFNLLKKGLINEKRYH